MKINILVLILTLGSAVTAKTQDLILNNYNLSPLQLNPALAGNSCGTRVATNMQTFVQNTSEDIYFLALSGGVDGSIKLADSWRLGGGYRYFQDVYGSAKFGVRSHLISSSIIKTMNVNKITHRFSYGFEGGYSNRSLNAGNLKWPSQITSNGFDPNLPSGEPSFSIIYFDLNAGLHYSGKWNSKHELNVGIAINHLNSPNISILGNNTLLKIRYVYYLQSKYMINNKIGLAPTFYYTAQDISKSYFASLGVEYAISEDKTILTITTGYQKNNNSFIGAQLKHKNLSIGSNVTVFNGMFLNKLETYLTYTFGNYACR